MKRFYRTKESNTFETQDKAFEAIKKQYIDDLKKQGHVNPTYCFIDDENTIHPIPEEISNQLAHQMATTENKFILKEMFKSFATYMNTLYKSELVAYVVVFVGTNIRIQGCDEETKNTITAQVNPMVYEFLEGNDNDNYLEPIVEKIKQEVTLPEGTTVDVTREINMFIETPNSYSHNIYDIIGSEEGDFVINEKGEVFEETDKFDENGELTEGYKNNLKGNKFIGVL